MKRIIYLMLGLLLVAGLGCHHDQPTGEPNSPIRTENKQVKLNLADAQQALTNARGFVGELLRRVKAHMDHPDQVQAPTEQEEYTLLKQTDDALGSAQESGKKAATGTEKIDAVADQQKAESDRKIKDALDKQQAWYDFVGSLAAAAGIGFVVFLLAERFSGYTFLVALGPAIVAGALTFVLFNKISHALMDLITVGKWVVGIGSVLLLTWYVWKRINTHGSLKAAFVNVELKK